MSTIVTTEKSEFDDYFILENESAARSAEELYKILRFMPIPIGSYVLAGGMILSILEREVYGHSFESKDWDIYFVQNLFWNNKKGEFAQKGATKKMKKLVEDFVTKACYNSTTFAHGTKCKISYSESWESRMTNSLQGAGNDFPSRSNFNFQIKIFDLGWPNVSLDLITREIFEDIGAVLDSFDLNICRCAYDFATRKFLVHKSLYKYFAHLNGVKPNIELMKEFSSDRRPLLSFSRILKYYERGFGITPQKLREYFINSLSQENLKFSIRDLKYIEKNAELSSGGF